MTSFHAPRQLGVFAGCRVARSLSSNCARRARLRRHPPRVDRPKGDGDGFAVLVTGEVHGMAQQMDNAGLNPGLRKGCRDSLRGALQPVHDGHQDVQDTLVAQVAQHFGPELRALIGLEPQPWNVPCAVRQDREGHETALFETARSLRILTLIAGFQWAVLPSRDLVYNGVGDRGN